MKSAFLLLATLVAAVAARPQPVLCPTSKALATPTTLPISSSERQIKVKGDKLPSADRWSEAYNVPVQEPRSVLHPRHPRPIARGGGGGGSSGGSSGGRSSGVGVSVSSPARAPVSGPLKGPSIPVKAPAPPKSAGGSSNSKPPKSKGSPRIVPGPPQHDEEDEESRAVRLWRQGHKILMLVGGGVVVAGYIL